MIANSPPTARLASRRLLEPEDLPRDTLHVFGYGSLLWRPGFSYLRQSKARLFGFHRALRVWSVHHRGTAHQPGLVLGLDAGGSCLGSLFEVAASDALETARYLWAREMVTSVYVPRLVPVYSYSGECVRALTFVLDRGHQQYAGPIAPEHAVDYVRRAEGVSGPNPEYVRETHAGLQRLGVHDGNLDQVVRLLDAGRER